MKNGKQNTNHRTSFFRLLTAFMLVAWTTTFSWSQIANAPCNLESPWIQGVGPGTYTNLEAKINDNVFSLLPPCLGSVSNVGDLIDGNLNNFAQIDITGIGCNATIGVRDKDAADTYPAGTFAGFNIGTGGLLPGAAIASSVTITTWNNGIQQESYNAGAALAGINLGFLIGDRYTVGFVTTKAFDEIRITYQTLVGVLFTAKVYHAVITKYCAGPTPVCNTPTGLVQDKYPAFISGAGVTGITLGSVTNADNVVNPNTNDFGTIALPVGILATGFIKVKDQLTDYPAGYFAGFEVANSSLIGLQLLDNSSVTTYLNGVQQESFSSNALLIDAPLFSGSGRQTVGFVTTKAFDEIKYTVSQPVGVNLGSTQVYQAIIKRYCAGPALSCNTSTEMVEPTYPVHIEGTHTGLSGLACVGCIIANTENIIDQQPTNYATVTLLAGVGFSASISVKDGLTDYPANTFVGYDIENITLIDVDLLDGIEIKTYLNGSLVETKAGKGDLVSAGTSLLTSDGRRTIGFITSLPFDEVQIKFSNLVNVDIGTTKVFKLVMKKFCAPTLVCDQTYFLVEPTHPVIINSERTGLSGLACVACSVKDAPNLLTPTNADYATITMVASVLESGSISIKNGIQTYPAGSTAGFVIQDMNTLLQADLFSSVTVCTYLNGAQQECKSAGDLIDLAVLNNWIGMGPGIYNIGFKTTKPYNEVVITVGSLASVINIIRVYAAYVDTRGAYGGGWSCNSVIDAIDDTYSSLNGFTGTTTANVLANDKLNAVILNPADVNLVPGVSPGAGITMNPNGTITIAPGTPTGNYSYPYQICEKVNPTNCDNAVAALQVNGPEPNYCITGCNDNAYVKSADPKTIEYDNIVSVFHSSLVKETDGTVKVWGEGISNSGGNVAPPIALNSTNFPALTGTVLKVTGASNVTGSKIEEQFAALTTNGLFIWGKVPGTLIPTTIKTGTAMQAVSIGTQGIGGTNPQGLPNGVAPTDVKMLFGAYKTLALVTCTGDAWVLSSEGNKNGDGTTGSSADIVWHRVKKNTTGNPNLTNVVAIRGTTNALFALTANGEMYTWGTGTYINSGAAQNRSYATLVTAPSGATPKMIGMTQSTTNQTYYMLATDGKVYSMGNNTQRQLGIGNTTTSNTWVQPQKPSSQGQGTGNLESIAWISPNEHDNYGQAAINVLTTSGQLWAWGSNSGNMIGGATDGTNYDPLYMPGRTSGAYNKVKLNIDDVLLAVETGGHTTITIKQCSKKFGYVGHKINGSMGDDPLAVGNPNTYDFENTVDLVVCGAPTTPMATNPPNLKVCPGKTTNLNLAITSPTPSGFHIEWWTTPNRLAGTHVADSTAAPVGNYYAFFIPNNSGPCPDPDATGIIVTADAANCIDAVNDNFGPVNGGAGGNTPSVLANDTFNGAPANLSTVSLTPGTPGNPGLSMNPDGTITVASGTAPGTYSYPYTICELANPSNCDTGIASVTVEFINTTFAVNDANITWTNTPVSGDVMTNDYDLESDAQVFQSFLKQDGSGTPVVLDGNGEFVVSGTDLAGNPVANAGKIKPDGFGGYDYTPAAGFNGKVSVPYAMEDNNSAGVAKDTAYLQFTVSPPLNGANSVIAQNDEYFTFGDPVQFNLLQNDGDPQGDNFNVTKLTYLDNNGILQSTTSLPGSPLTVSGVDENGNVVVAGTVTLNAAGALVFTPNGGFKGKVTLNYEITDDNANPAKSNADVVLIVGTDNNGVNNDPPFAGDDFATTTINQPVSGNFFGNDDDPNGDAINMNDGNGNHITINPANPKTGIRTLTTVEGGTVEFFANGTFDYTPPTGYTGPDKVVYEICDVSSQSPGSMCSYATIYLGVGPDPCDYDPAGGGTPSDAWAGMDCDGDGVTNGQELTDGTDPKNPCSYNAAHQVYANTTAAWKAMDCDSDGMTNAEEITGVNDPSTPANPGGSTTDPKNPDTDGDGVTDGDERTTNGPGDPLTDANNPCSFNVAEQGTPGAAWNAADCDGDGVTNGNEITNGGPGDPVTNPLDPCSYNTAEQVFANTTAAWKALDCDGDGNPNGGDPDPKVATARDDAFTAPFGGPTSYNILANDDFLANDGNTITKVGGTAGGTVAFNPVTGDMTYTPLAGEVNSTLTVVYEVCQGAVCDQATVTITVPAAGDSDGDGDPDNTDPEPNNPCVWGSTHTPTVANTSAAWKAGDCDGDGVTNGNEIASSGPGDPATNPLDPCNYNVAEQVIANTSAAWKAMDCDNDGLDNGEETTGLDNPLTPANPGGSTTDPKNPDTDGDGVTDGDERTTNGPGDPLTDANNPCNYNVAEQVLANTTAAWKAMDCDNDGLDNGEETTGLDNPVTPANPGGSTTDPKNPDTDGDGVTDGDERTSNGPGDPLTDANNPCSFNVAEQGTPGAAWNAADCDGDGVTNGDEITSGGSGDPVTNPLDPCSYNKAEQVFANTTAAWKALDCDGDGNPNGGDPDPKVATARDDAFTAPFGGPTSYNILANDDFLANDGNTITKVGGTAGGTVAFNPVTGDMTYTPLAGEVNSTLTVVYEVCQGAVCDQATVTITVPAAGDSDGDGDPDNTDPEPNNPCVWGSTHTPTVANTSAAWKAGDCDGDGVTNGNEIASSGPGDPATNPLDPCNYNVAEQVIANTSAAWKAMDCDNDGLDNGEETTGLDNPLTPANPGGSTTDPKNPDTDGDGVTDGDERTSNGPGDPLTDANNPCSFNVAEQGTPGAAWNAADCDGDGVTNGNEITNGGPGDPVTNPLDPCSYNTAEQVFANTTAAWKALDCDGDGNPNGGDPDPKVATARDDAFTAPFGGPTSYNILANDDFLANDGNTITKVGGTAGGTVAFNPVTGDMTYTPLAGEVNSTLTVVYEVCQGAVCDQATVTITVPAAGDSDGDGDPDNTDPEPNNPCVWGSTHTPTVANTSAAWKAGDCDGDGVTNGNEIASSGPGDPATNPLDPCNYNVAEQVIANTSAAWKAMDCDNDGLDNGEETTGLDNPLTPANPGGSTTDPKNPDTDGDGVTDGDERTTNGPGDPLTDANNPCNYNVAEQVLANTTAAWKAMDCDNDGLDNGEETTGLDNPVTPANPGGSTTDPKNPDTDGDGVTDGDERTSNGPGDPLTDANNPCSFNVAEQGTPGAAWNAADCDGDGVTNGDEITSGGSGDPVTNPLDPCSYNKAEQVFANTTAAWKALDCDGDGNPNGGDPDPKVATARDDAFTAPYGAPTSYNILANDDFLANDGNTITKVGGTAGGTVTFNPVTGNMTYAPLFSEIGNTVTVVYEVCQGVVCDQATATINVTDVALQLNLKALLQGAYSTGTGLMRDDLRVKSLIPLTQPYGDAAYSDLAYSGTETTTNTVLSVAGADAIVDWVLVELRDRNNPATVISRQAALIQRDGDIVAVDGVSSLSFNLPFDSYYIAVKHRNHLGVMTKTPYALSSTPVLVDFTSTSVDNYKLSGVTASDYAQKVASNGKRLLWASNVQKEGNVYRVIYQGPNNEVTPVFIDILTDPLNVGLNANFIKNGYLRSDVTMDGRTIYQGPSNEVDVIYFEVITHPENTSIGANFIINQQIP